MTKNSRKTKPKNVTPLINTNSMAKQLSLIHSKQFEWKLTHAERAAARRGIAASREALKKGRRRWSDILDAA